MKHEEKTLPLIEAGPEFYARDVIRLLGHIDKIDSWSFMNLSNNKFYGLNTIEAVEGFRSSGVAVRLFVCVRVRVCCCLCVCAGVCVLHWCCCILLWFFSFFLICIRPLGAVIFFVKSASNSKLLPNERFCFCFAIIWYDFMLRDSADLMTLEQTCAQVIMIIFLKCHSQYYGNERFWNLDWLLKSSSNDFDI